MKYLLATLAIQQTFGALLNFINENSRENISLDLDKKRLISIPVTQIDEQPNNMTGFIQGAPTIGILTQPVDNAFKNYYRDMNIHSKVFQSYGKWLKDSGANVIAIPYNLTKKKTRKLLKSVNGLILPGGHINTFFKTKYLLYRKKVDYVINYAKELNSRGIHYPIFGICQGFNHIINNFANHEIEIFVAKNWHRARKLHFKLNMLNRSLLRKELSDSDINDMKTKKLAYFNNTFAISYESYLKNKFQNKNFYVVASFYKRHQKLVAMIETKGYPFFATQFHPEKITHDQNRYNFMSQLPKGKQAKYMSNKFGRFFVNQASLNDNKFASESQFRGLNISNAKVVDSKNDRFGNVLIFTKDGIRKLIEKNN